MKNRPSDLAIISLVLLALTAGCGGDDEEGGHGDVPTIAIVTPANGATVTLGTDVDKSVPVVFTTTYFTMKPPGDCGSLANCGHIHVSIDGDDCTPSGEAYNNAGASSPINARFALCPLATGAHEILLDLHTDSHAAILHNNVAIQSKVNVTTQ